jgi:hypothetical protein
MLIDFLHVNGDMFAWGPLDMLGIPRDVVELLGHLGWL